MWDSASLQAMNDRAQREGVVRTETIHDVGPHAVVDVKTYGDGHQVFTCRTNSCRTLSEEELKAKNCGRAARRAGWN